MELPRLIEALSSPAAFPSRPASVEVRHTHISAVFIAGNLVYKVKKPVNFGFLDFTDPAGRKHFCEEEVRLNRRLAPSVYLGVVPITLGAEGPRFEGAGEPIEWAVKMARLPDGATLAARLKAGEVGADVFKMLGARIAEFHRRVPTDDAISAHGSFEVVAKNSRENFQQSLGHVGTTIDGGVMERLFAANDRALERFRPLIEVRAGRGMTRDVHGDLHLDHVYLFPEKPYPDDLAILDCVEFNDSYRCSDVVADMAFLCMDLIFHGRKDLADLFADAYFAASGDEEGRALLDFYVAYRAAVRGKVEGMQALAEEVPAASRASAKRSSRAHWLVALGSLSPPAERPALLLTSGLPGSGKSRLASDLCAHAGFTRVVSDVVRKELAGKSPTESAKAGFGEGIYTPEWNERTYAECLSRARDLLFTGQRVIVDASFREESKRNLFRALALEMGVPFLVMHRSASDEVTRERLMRRTTRSISDADYAISKEAEKRWEPPSEELAKVTVEIPHMAEKNGPLGMALGALMRVGLY